MKEINSRSSIIQGELNFAQVYSAIGRRWWWLIGAMVAGALAGLILSAVLPPAYQATASLGIGIDYGRTHSLEREAERQALLQVQELLLSDAVLQAAIDSASPDLQTRNGLAGAEAFRGQLRLDRFDGRWDMSVYSRFPADAAELANYWSQAAVEAIEAALQAAWQARDLQQKVYGLGCSLEAAEGSQQPVFQCLHGETEQAVELQQSLVEAVQKSQGLLPALTFAQLRQASVSDEPVYRGRSWLVLGGLMIGLALGLALILAAPYPWSGNSSTRLEDQTKVGPNG